MKTWDNGHKVLGILLAITVIIAILLGYCKRPSGEKCPETRDTTITKIHIDTIPFDTIIFTYHDVPVPKPYYVPIYDTVPFYSKEEPDFDNILDYYSFYIDTIRDSVLDIWYKAQVRGYMDSITIGRKIKQPYSIKRTETIRTLTTITERSSRYALYIGFDAGGNKDSFGYFKPELTLSSKRSSYSIGYNIPDKSITAGIKLKLLPLKR